MPIEIACVSEVGRRHRTEDGFSMAGQVPILFGDSDEHVAAELLQQWL